MRLTVSPRVVASAALLLAVCAVPAQAQRALGPFGGVLGGSSDAQQSLDVRASIFGAWDDLLTETEPVAESGIDDRFLRGGAGGGATAGLSYARRTQSLNWTTNANTAMRLYGSDSGDLAATFGARTNLSTTSASRFSWNVSGGWSYSPFYQVTPDLGIEAMNVTPFGGGFGVATAAERNSSFDASGRLSVTLSRRDSLSVSGSTTYYDFLDQENSALTSYGGIVTFSHSLTRALSARAGIGRQEVRYDYEGADSVPNTTIDAGLEYGDTLTFARRTALSFSTSTSAVRWNDSTHYRLNGSLGLTRAFGRTGSGSLNYTRDTSFQPGFREPLLTDGVSGAFSDQIGRRASWAVGAGYTRGNIGFDDDAGQFKAFNAGGRLTSAITRHLAVFGDYSFYRYEAPSNATVFTFLPKFSRQSVSVGLSVWAPLINERSPRDTR